MADNDYCMKCKVRTENKDAEVVQSASKGKSTRSCRKSVCGSCGSKKCRFVAAAAVAAAPEEVSSEEDKKSDE